MQSNIKERNADQLTMDKLCRVFGVSQSGYYAWVKRAATLVSAGEWRTAHGQAIVTRY